MSARFLVVAMAGAVALCGACKSRGHVPPEPGKAVVADAGVAPSQGRDAVAPVAPQTPPVPHVATPKAPAAPEPGAPAVMDKDKLAKCYQEVYCAQKKGEMDKILNIYKSYGFDTPQEFTKAWIDAAKDTDWVTRIAHDVAKGCK